MRGEAAHHYLFTGKGVALLFVKFILIPIGLSGYNGGAKKQKIYEVSIVEP